MTDKQTRESIEARFSNEYGTPYGIKRLLDAPKGTTLFTVLRHVSSSGMTRWIDVYMMADNEPIWLSGALSTDKSKHFNLDKKRESIKVGGCGMDMGFHLVYNIGLAIHGDGYHFTQRWL